MLATLIIVLILVGVGLWLINTYVPMQPAIKTILNVVAVLVVIIWVAQMFGLFGGHFRVPKW